MERETRTWNLKELRTSTSKDNKQKITGLAVVYNSTSEFMGMYEVIKRGALTEALKKDNEIFANVEHDNRQILAKRSNNSLKLNETEKGLEVEIHPTDTSYSRDLISNIKNGLIEGMSFSFSLPPVGGVDWSYDSNDVPVRTISKIDRLYDITLTSEPAYSETTVAMRDLKSFKEGLDKEKQKNIDKEKQEINNLKSDIKFKLTEFDLNRLGVI